MNAPSRLLAAAALLLAAGGVAGSTFPGGRVAGDTARYEDRVRHALDLLALDSLEAGEQALRQILAVWPQRETNAVLYRHLGTLAERDGRWEEALDDYTRGLTLSPRANDLRMARAALYYAKGQAARAVSDYTCVIDEGKADVEEALFFRAHLYMTLRDYRRSRLDYERLYALQPDREEVLVGLALLADKDNRPREAMERMDALVALYPSHALPWALRGGMKQRRGQYEDALRDLTRAISLDGDEPDYYVSRATLLLEMKRKRAAREDLRRAVELGADPVEMASLLK